MSYPPPEEIHPPPQLHRGQPQTSHVAWIVGVLAGMLTVGGIFCCGGGLIIMGLGMQIMSSEVQESLAMRPEVREHIGEIESFKVNMIRSGADEHDDVFFYDIVGTKGRGRVRVEQTTNEDGTEHIIAAELTMSDGRKIPIDFAREASEAK